MEMGGSSNALDASASTQDLKYIQALTINVSNFVSVRLSMRSNYKIWKAQMLCLIKSQVLLHIVDAEHPFPVDKGVHMIEQYKELVKGWIFGSVNEKLLLDLVDLATAQEVWMKLEALFNVQPVSDREGDSSNAPDVSALHAIAPVVYAMREDLKYLQALNVDVSNFVSEKFVGERNYYTWKNEMLCLIRSHELLHIIHDKARLPWDEGDPMTQKYDSLVRGWILNTMNDKQRDKYQIYRSVQLMWRRLESTFRHHPETSSSDIEDTEDCSSSETEDMEYMQLKSIINVSHFVSEKLSGRNNYSLWKEKMLHLLESQSLLHIVNAEAQKYGKLVRYWILSTMNDEVRHKFRIYRSVKLMWSNIESTFGETEDFKYIEASNVNVSNFVSVNLSDDSNYNIWRARILYLLESHGLLHIINERYYPGEYKYGKLAKVWILCTMNDKLLKQFPAEDYVNTIAKDLWVKLESRFTKDYSGPEPIVSASIQDLKYAQALSANVSNFVSVKLSGRNNYRIWKAQMLFLIKSQKLLHVIDNKDGYKVDKYEHLVKGWIFSTMHEQLLSNRDFTDNNDDSAKDIWEELKSALDSQDPQEVELEIEFIRDDTELDNTDKNRWYKDVVEGWWRKAQSIFKINKNIATEATTANDNTILHVAVERESSGIEVVRSTPDIETESSRVESTKKELFIAAAKGWWRKAKSILKINKNVATEAIIPDIKSVKKELYKAAAEGRWRKAKSILMNRRIAATMAITKDGNTILHIAVEMSHNYFVEELLECLENGEEIEKKNKNGQTALHIAAMVGNTHAAQLLVRKRKNLLEIKDHEYDSPLDLASQNKNLNIYAYLFKSLEPSISHFRSYRSHRNSRSSLLAAIYLKQYDLVEELLKVVYFYSDYDVLMAMTITFPTDLGFMETVIYPFPTAILYSIYQLICLFILMLHLSFSMLYLLLWKVSTVIVLPIKNIEKKKKEYQKAKKIMRMVCRTMVRSGHANPTNYRDSLFEAVRLDRYEVVDEILFISPATINCKDEDGYNIIQSSILNRAEKVYNLIYHISERTKSHRELIDSSMNNLGHLAGRLAPAFVLSRTTGAALQLQRELLWFEEVEKLVLPLQLTKKNIYNETPAMVFTREHQDLLRQGETWMKITAESCRITVALIVTVVFAAAITVPGGNDQESGIPLFKNEISFTIFALSNAFSLFTGTTSLLMFLSILTARSSEKDFLVSLPRKLIIGLLMLFLSTIAMMVAFSAILFLVFCDRRPWMLAPICAFACLPISVIVIIKLPLLVDLIQSTYSPIFGKQRYIETCKVNRKNTIFIKR